MCDVEKRKLSELRVVDLKQELEKRGKDGNGVKNVLIERLTQALKDEKLDPDTYEFEIATGKTPAKKKVPSSGTKADEDVSDSAPQSANEENADVVVVLDDSEEAEKNAGTGKREGSKVVKDAQKNGKEDTKDGDHDDSLNLTIGEEDEKLLHDDSNADNDKKSGDAGKVPQGDKLDSKLADVKQEEVESDPSAASKDDTENTGKTPSNSAKSGSNDSKPKSSPNASEKSTTVSRNLWVSGLSSLTRATDLKLIFSKYGKVIGAKVVTNTRTPGTRCYGYVTMASAKDATECITHLHRTELHGRVISVERAKGDLAGAVKGASGGSVGGGKAETSKPAEEEVISKDKDKEEKPDERGDRSRSQYRGRSRPRTKSQPPATTKSQERDDKSKDDKDNINREFRREDRPRIERNRRDRNFDLNRDRRRSRERDVLSLQKIREERDRERLREKERQLREEERRRREIRARQREEEIQLRREREKLALERARIEKEKAELLRIERERQKLEREKIELERLELKRQQRKIEEAKRSLKRPAAEHPHYDEDRKRLVAAERRVEPPPPPSISASRAPPPYGTEKRRLEDYTRRADDHKGRDDYKPRQVDDYRRDNFKRNGGVIDDYKREMDRPMQPIDSRYPDNRSGGGSGGGEYRGNSGQRDDRERNGGMKSRYMDPIDNRYPDRSSGSGNGPWNAGAQQMNMGQSMSNDGWRMDNGADRYDRSYNDRKGPQMSGGPFMDIPRQNQFMSGSSSGGRLQDRYGTLLSRFDNGRY